MVVDSRRLNKISWVEIASRVFLKAHQIYIVTVAQCVSAHDTTHQGHLLGASAKQLCVNSVSTQCQLSTSINFHQVVCLIQVSKSRL